jgi:hypothetical protein
VIERLEDRVGARGVGGAQVAERLVGEHDAPAEGVVWTVALDDRHFVVRVAAFHQKAKVQPSRTAADTDNAHACSPMWTLLWGLI